MLLTCSVCGKSFEAVLIKRPLCGKCTFSGLGLKRIRHKKAKLKTLLEQLGIDWIGRYYSTLDPKLTVRFYIRRRIKKVC